MRIARQRGFLARGFALVLMLSGGVAHAQIVQGNMELQWGDPRGGPGQPKQPAKFNATLVTDDGVRHVLDAAQARRAAGDLYALSSRRVAVQFSPAKRAGGLRSIEAIVPVEPLRTTASARVMSMAKAVTGNTRWVTLACKFSDIATEQKPVTFFQDQYGIAPGQLGHYWQAAQPMAGSPCRSHVRITSRPWMVKTMQTWTCCSRIARPLRIPR